nr:RHS domain-containing protein [Marinobacter sp. F3R11]
MYEPDTFKPLALVDGYGPEQSSIYYYHLDHLGTPQELTNARGDLVWSVTYRAYGNVVQQQVAEIDNPLRFQGQLETLIRFTTKPVIQIRGAMLG